VTFDPEIAGIFAEEAAEILDNAELALRSIRQKPEPATTVELQRLLHTSRVEHGWPASRRWAT